MRLTNFVFTGVCIAGVGTLSVELAGIEPATPCLQSRCSSQLSYSPEAVILSVVLEINAL